MIITFIRRGFASNSSSSHSIIFSNNNLISDQFDEYTDYDEFGWNFFTCKTKICKTRYLLLTLMANISYNEKDAFIRANISELSTFIPNVNRTLNKIKDGYIDHQSVIRLPSDYSNPEYPSIKFFKDLYKELVERDYIILGGNDNDDTNHPLTNSHINNDDTNKVIHILYKLTYQDDLYCVKDPITKEWTLSNNDKGLLFKIIFNHDLTILQNEKQNVFEELNDDTISYLIPKKSTYPYLVDLKITDKCSYNCNFCYQNSTLHGKHADANFIINNIIPELKAANVFEVVIGGGEPTTHPELDRIVAAFKKNKFKISLTTKNYNIGSTKKEIRVLENINALAFSANTEEELQLVIAQVNKLMLTIYNSVTIYIQSILELITDLPLHLDIINKSRVENITFVGFKNKGRGTNFTVYEPYYKWYDILKQYSKEPYYLNFGVDSVLVHKYKSELEHAGVHSKYLVSSEGKTTCYIDAVNKIVAPSSFTNKKNIKYNFNNSEFLNIFKQF
jgi:organic radical activating enzyme